VAGSRAWAGQPTPNPLTPTASLDGVSCPAPSSCTAVGRYFDSAGYWAALAQAWDGTSWAVQPVPDPPGGTGVALSGVSCSAAGACVAVGSYVDPAGSTVALAESWNGATWSILPVPAPPGSTESVLLGVSCTTAVACASVGYYTRSGTGYLTLAEAWNGTSWQAQATPNPAGAAESALSGVSCTPAGGCMAVGYFIGDLAAGTLAEAWGGSSWRIQATPSPPGYVDAGLAGISCTAASACTAVGGYFTPAQAGKTLAESWDGTSWRIQATPDVAGAQANSLSAVSCRTAGACTAVGEDQAVGQPGVTLAEAWNGTSWQIQATPDPAGALATTLTGVSCPAASTCLAVGSHLTTAATSLTLAEAWDGTSWQIQAIPSPAGATRSELSAVSCLGAAACMAVGSDTNVYAAWAERKTLAEWWDGASWRIRPSPTLASGSVLSGVSCAGAGTCMAVGYRLDGLLRPLSLAELWNGTTWKVVPTPNPPGNDIVLSGVSCTAPDACTAVGSSVDPSGTQVTLAESWNGTTWTIRPSPDPAGATFSQLSAVSCTGRVCTAVGRDTAGTLAESWGGTAWTIQPTPSPAGDTASLSGVSCSAPAACTAVGSYRNPAHLTVPLAEARNGATWRIEATPIASRDTPSALSAVSCVAAAACTAVGYRGGTSGQVPLAEAWNGTAWSIQPTPRPAGSVSSALAGVSCPAALTCTAAGSYVTPSPDDLTLVQARH
jgi:hypothetical protein